MLTQITNLNFLSHEINCYYVLKSETTTKCDYKILLSITDKLTV